MKYYNSLVNHRYYIYSNEFREYSGRVFQIEHHINFEGMFFQLIFKENNGNIIVGAGYFYKA